MEVRRRSLFGKQDSYSFKSPLREVGGKDRDTGGSRGVMAPSKILGSCCSRTLLFHYFSISEYQIGTPLSHIYLVQFLPFISIGSPLEVFNS